MDAMELVPFEGTQSERFEDFHASNFHIKDAQNERTSVAKPAEPNGELRLSCARTSDADSETCEEDNAAPAPQGRSFLSCPSEAQRDIPAVEERPSNRTVAWKVPITRLPGKSHLDSKSFSDLPECYARYYSRSTSKSKVKHTRENDQLHDVPTQFFEVPIESYDVDLLQRDTASSGERIGLGSSTVADSYFCTPSERKASSKPLKQICHSPSSCEKRHPTPKQSRVSVDYSECVELSTDSEPCERPSKTPKTSSTKWKHRSADCNTKGILPNGKRTLHNGFREKTSRSSGHKVKDKKSKPRGSEFQRIYNSPNAITEEILPVGWRLSSPDTCVEEILPTEKMRILESKLKETKRRTIERKLEEMKSKILESESKLSCYAPQARAEDTLPAGCKYKTTDPSTGKGTLESKSKDKNRRTVESIGEETKSKTLEGESRQRRSASNSSVDDVLPMNWRLPEEKSLLERKWKELTSRVLTTRRPVDNGLKMSCRDGDGSTEKILPLKRKHGSFDASMEEILPSEKMRIPDSKLKDKINKTSKTKSKEKKTRTNKSEFQQRSDVPISKDGKPARRASIPIRKLKSGYTSEHSTTESERDVAGPGISHPTFASEMKHSNVVKCFWMGIPADFNSRHMPDHDQFIVLQDANGLKWEANYLARKKGLSGGWRRFAMDHHLEMGDIVVFELVKPRKFLVHITKVCGGDATLAHPVRETTKKLHKTQVGIGTNKRVSSLESALVAKRKRVNKDAERKLPSKKPRLAGGVKKDRKGEEEQESGLKIPSAKPNRLFYPRAVRNRKVAMKTTDHYGDQNAPLTFEDSEGDEALETKRVASLPKFKPLSRSDDGRSDSEAGMDLQELALTVYQEPAFVPSLESQKAGSLSPKPGSKEKLRRVTYFYSTDEDQGNST